MLDGNKSFMCFIRRHTQKQQKEGSVPGLLTQLLYIREDFVRILPFIQQYRIQF